VVGISVTHIPYGDETTEAQQNVSVDIENATLSPSSSPTKSPTMEPHVCDNYCFEDTPQHFVADGKKCFCTPDCLEFNDCCGGTQDFKDKCGSTCSGAHSCKTAEPMLSGCFCDVHCELNGDCCPDIDEHCRSPAGDLNTCKLGCGLVEVGFQRFNTNEEGDEFECFCDHSCLEYGDCCADYEEECANVCAVGDVMPCACDALCESYGDCCEDYPETFISKGVAHSGTKCDRRCGEIGCDLLCTDYDDCVAGFAEACDASCDLRCGVYTTNAFCQCDDLCESTGDCCPDKLLVCGR